MGGLAANPPDVPHSMRLPECAATVLPGLFASRTQLAPAIAPPIAGGYSGREQAAYEERTALPSCLHLRELLSPGCLAVALAGSAKCSWRAARRSTSTSRSTPGTRPAAHPAC